MGFLDGLFVDPKELEGTQGMIQLLVLMCGYAYVLFCGSNLISDGSELLLLIPSLAGIIGSVVLPVLGAVPDGAIVLFSGLGDDAQNELKVGVGALAGSTVMLLTVPWTLAIIGGRVNLKGNEGSYSSRPKLFPPNNRSLTHTGVVSSPAVGSGGWIMALTCIVFVIIQGPAFAYDCGTGSTCDKKGKQHWYAFAGMIFCVCAFSGYLIYQVKNQDSDNRQNKLMATLRRAIDNGDISVVAAFADLLRGEMAGSQGTERDAEAALLTNSAVDKHLYDTLRHFFIRYDHNGDNQIDERELTSLMRDLNEHVTPEEMSTYFTHMDRNSDGYIDLEEFYVGLRRYILMQSTRHDGIVSAQSFAARMKSPTVVAAQAEVQVPYVRRRRTSSYRPAAIATATAEGESETKTDSRASPSVQIGNLQSPNSVRESPMSVSDDDEEDDEDEEEIPEDLQNLPPDVQQRRILMRSCWMMTLGTLLVLVFSDPMVGVLSEFGNRLHVSPFYVSFILAPFASNASEFIASYNYAQKKTPKSIAISLTALEGAASMNNTFSVGIFLALVFFKKLAWEFAAETISLVVIQLIMAVIAQRKTFRLIDGVLISSLYPLALVIVVALEAAGLN